MKEITTIIVHYQASEVLQRVVESFKKIHSAVKTMIFHNGCLIHSKTVISKLDSTYLESVSAHEVGKKSYHGPALNIVLTVPDQGVGGDSSKPKNDAFGNFIRANQPGFKNKNGSTAVALPYFLYREEYYDQFHPFIVNGKSVLINFKDAQEKGYHLTHHPIEYRSRGTASKKGYKLRFKGKIDHLLNKLGI